MQINSDLQKIKTQENLLLFVEAHVSFVLQYAEKLHASKHNKVRKIQKSIANSILLQQYIHMNYFSKPPLYLQELGLAYNIVHELVLLEGILEQVINDRQLLHTCLQAIDHLKSYYPRIYRDDNTSLPWIVNNKYKGGKHGKDSFY